MACVDLAGLAVSTTSSAALAAYERGVDLFLRWRAGAMEALEAATTANASATVLGDMVDVWTLANGKGSGPNNPTPLQA